ncbi:TRAP transporter small permease [Variovorax sp. J2P1-59]|uniref:TRAP transporter small permease subunit n=1 Tax=Variovorax flavidus TaxID=3053501 RepID=UPI0025766DCD|nr:TRAP transporter small permease [Variovorax sp. J2P1-59]MDM0073919.1 TRAP transporter small permease [Variovorax sp. J2P1-59]
MKTLLPQHGVSRALTRVCDWTVIACGWWLIALSVMTCVEMLGRKVFSFSLQGIDEIGSYTYGIVGAFGFAYTLITRSHTRVDFLLSRFSLSTRATLNMLAMVSLAALAVLCFWRGYNVVVESIELRSTAATPLATPMWIPQSIWLGGYLMFALVGAWAALDALRLFFKRRTGELNERFGPQTIEEEIEAETEVQLKTPAAAASPATAMPATGAAS